MSRMTDKQICIVGEVLFDQFPGGQQVLGGAPFNVAWHLQAFGQQPCFISRVGQDKSGDIIREAMMAWGMAADNLQIDADHPTGTVAVTISNGEPHYAILDHQAYDYIDSGQLQKTNSCNVIYHGVLAFRNPVSRQALDDLIAAHTGKIFIDVNLREPWWRNETVNQLVNRADWAKLNEHELMQLAPPHHTMQDTMRWFRTEYNLETLIITCGDRGAMAINQADELIQVQPAANLAIVDTVGAGDAFSAVVLLGLQLDWPLPETMARAQSFAAALVSQRGATVRDLNFYQAFIKAWSLH
ncbi:MAG: carbohydrate kinase family protein [Methylococcaceae bacterium]